MRSYLLIVFLFISGVVQSQNIPAYNAVVYDSTLTGYYFLASLKLGTQGVMNTPVQMILNSNGETVYYHPFAAGSFMLDFKIQPNGQITYFDNGQFYIADSNFQLIDSIACIGYETDVHDLQILTYGNYLLLGVEYDTMDLSSYHYFHHNGSAGSATAIVISNIIQELDTAKNVVFEWHSKNHFQFADVDPFFLNSATNVDWTHCNAVEKDTDGNILLSTRHFNEITKIEFSTGNILWRMGGKQNQFTFINDSLQFYGQHDIRRIATGHVTLFDNGRHNPSHGARGLTYSLNEINKTATLVWQYTYAPNVNSLGTGNTQRMANRTLIDYGFRTNSKVCFTMVDSSNAKLFELSFADTSASYRAFYYPNLPWAFNRPSLSCFQQGNDYYLQPAGNFSSYLWSNGETTAAIKISALGDYFTYVPYGDGFIKSELFKVTSLTDPCNATGIADANHQAKTVAVFPNPFYQSTTITGQLPYPQLLSISIFDIQGMLVKTLAKSQFTTGAYSFSWNGSNENNKVVNSAIYFLKIETDRFVETKKITLLK